MPTQTKQEVKNECYKSLDTKESKKCIKEEKKIDIESIFIKKKTDEKKEKKKDLKKKDKIKKKK